MKLIDLLLRLYPEEFRARFGRDMRAFHAERVREANVPWFRIVSDHLRSAASEQLRSVAPNARFALRSMRRRPGFTAVVVITIALGVGANAAIFSVVNGVLLRPLPYPEAERIVSFRHEPPQWLTSAPQFATYRRMQSFEYLAAYSESEMTLATAEDPERLAAAAVTHDFFTTLGIGPLLGRTHTRDETRVRPSPIVVISHDLWQRVFDGDRSVIGKSITLNGTGRTVIGVMPAGFGYPRRETAIWLPICSQRTCDVLGEVADSLDGWAVHYLSMVGRLRRGFSEEHARAEALRVARQIMRENPDNFHPEYPLLPSITTIRDNMVGNARPFLYALFGAVGVVLLVVCANVANLLLARGEARQREMAVRTALGASRRRLFSQLITEALIIALAGAALGLAIGWAGHRFLIALAPASLPRLDEIRLDTPVLLFSLATAIVAALTFGMLPALRGSAEQPADALRSAGKGVAAVSSGRARRALVVLELALAMVLLSGAGMLVRSLIRMHETNLGFRPAGALTAQVSLNATAYDDARAIQFYSQLIERLRAVPGVRAVGAARWLPIVDAGGLWDISIEGKSFPQGHVPAAVPQEVTTGYFAAMGMRLQRGRDFTDADRAGAPLVAVVSESFANTIWQGEDPIGRRFRLGRPDIAWATVIGVVGDILARGHTDRPEPTMYFPHAQTVSGYYVPRTMSIVLRSETDPLRLARPLRTALRQLDPMVALSRVRSLDAVVATSTANRRFATALISGFAVLALVLATIGIYGVISYTIAERTFEFGVRLALGAERRNILGLVLADGARLAALGIVTGLACSAVLAHVIRGMLFGVPRFDFTTFALVGVALAAVTVAASTAAGRRATAVQPTEALRSG